MIIKNFIGDNSGVSLLKTFLVLFVIIVTICFIWYIVVSREISCDSENRIELRGIFRGFYPCQNFSGYTSIVIGNNSFLFRRGLDQSYLNNLIGFNVCFVCCERTSSSQYQPETYFDFLSGVIVME